jgi:hypothetical protein
LTHPYKNAPEYRMWRKAVAEPGRFAVDPVVKFPFSISPTDKVVTAGSCFAQHIARHLKNSGFNFYVTEPGHEALDDDTRSKFGYGLFSARYGNIYTARQLRQLIERAYGEFTPADDAWQGKDGRWFDPFRPTIQPDGFATREEFDLDRQQHFAAVRKALESLDIFVFTLGLTEAWVSAEDGAAYPICPGVAAGAFDPERHVFKNFSVLEIIADMTAVIERLRQINPRSRVILTVSPVPLMATAEDRHVLVATTYSKSVLRVAADELSRALPDVAYFPSYEVITGNHARGRYFAEDLRSVREVGVEHVMRLFFRHATTGAPQARQKPRPAERAKARPNARPGARPNAGTDARDETRAAARVSARRHAGAPAKAEGDSFNDRMQQVADAQCDEELLDAT